MHADARARPRTGAVAAGAVALVASVAAVLARPADERPLTVLLLVAGLAGGLALGLRLTRRWGRGPRRPRSAAERFNDGAFAVVLLAGWLVVLTQLGPWAGLLTGIAAGILAAVALRAARRAG
jgi:hypothetical protein